MKSLFLALPLLLCLLYPAHTQTIVLNGTDDKAVSDTRVSVAGGQGNQTGKFSISLFREAIRVSGLPAFKFLL